jgi:hypothetical protein
LLSALPIVDNGKDDECRTALHWCDNSSNTLKLWSDIGTGCKSVYKKKKRVKEMQTRHFIQRED